jgi:AcrR family transcriptional regulator
MAESVKDGSRSARARSTRRRIIDAAAALFVDQGYGKTTLEQVAERAGVAVQTVYFHFGNKRTVLKEALDVAAVGDDDEPVALLDRPWFDRVQDEPDPRRVISLWTENSRTIVERVGPILGVVRDAAVVDADMATQWDTNERQRLVAFRTLAQLLADRDALKPDMSVADATDITFMLLGPETYLLLTTRRNWTPAKWQRWVTATLTSALLR